MRHTIIYFVSNNKASHHVTNCTKTKQTRFLRSQKLKQHSNRSYWSSNQRHIPTQVTIPTEVRRACFLCRRKPHCENVAKQKGRGSSVIVFDFSWRRPPMQVTTRRGTTFFLIQTLGHGWVLKRGTTGAIYTALRVRFQTHRLHLVFARPRRHIILRTSRPPSSVTI